MRVSLLILAIVNFILSVSLLSYRQGNISSAIKYTVSILFTAFLIYLIK